MMNLVYTTIAKARCYKIKDLRCKELNFKDERRETPSTVFCLKGPSDKGYQPSGTCRGQVA